MQFPLKSKFDEWDENFTTKSADLATYEISYGLNKSYTLKLRVSSLNCGCCYAWELSTRDDKLQRNLSLSCTSKNRNFVSIFYRVLTILQFPMIF